MPLRPVEDPDPLLEFSNEAGVADSSAPPLEQALQPIAAAADRAPIQQSPVSDPALIARVERLERALDESKSQVAVLKSDVATLVRTIADIRKPPRPPVAALISPKLASPRVVVGTAPKLAGLILGAALGIGGWMYLSSDGDATITARPAAAAPTSYMGGLAPNVTSPQSYIGGLAPNVTSAPASYTGGLAPKVTSPPARERYVRGQPPDVARAKYVGTLSIDADPGGEVFVNRERAGTTPLRLTNLRAGSHLIWIERDGYRRWTRVVNVPADRITRLSAELEPLAR